MTTRSGLSRRRFISISAAAMLTGPSLAKAADHEARWRGIALGAEASITLRGPIAEAEPALRAAREEIKRMEALFSLYDSTSSLSHLNRRGALAAPDRDFLHLLRRANRVNQLTGGLFDPTIQPLWDSFARSNPPIGTDELQELSKRIDWASVEVNRAEVRFRRPDMALTLNGIAQGYATDRIASVLDHWGFGDSLVNIGEFKACEGPWRLGIEDPSYGLVAVRELNSRAIATSSPSALSLAGGSQDHIINPKSLHAKARWSTVSVEATTATLADAYSTALTLMDRASIISLLEKERNAIFSVLLVDKSGRSERLSG